MAKIKSQKLLDEAIAKAEKDLQTYKVNRIAELINAKIKVSNELARIDKQILDVEELNHVPNNNGLCYVNSDRGTCTVGGY